MSDTRFWSGAVVAVTIVVAGAGALPALLRSPEPTPARVAVEVTKAAEPAKQEPPRIDLVVEPIVLTSPPAVEREPAAPEPLIEPVRLPEPSAVPAQATEPVQAAATVVFPPVQPIGVAAAGEADAPLSTSKETTGATTAEKSGHRALSTPAAQRKRAVRPAVYPIREFFAWRR